MKGGSSENKIVDLFQECIDKKKMWTLLEKNFGAICIKFSDSGLMVKHIYSYVVLKKCQEVNITDSFVFFSPNEITKPRKQNPLEMSSLRLAG